MDKENPSPCSQIRGEQNCKRIFVLIFWFHNDDLPRFGTLNYVRFKPWRTQCFLNINAQSQH